MRIILRRAVRRRQYFPSNSIGKVGKVGGRTIGTVSRRRAGPLPPYGRSELPDLIAAGS